MVDARFFDGAYAMSGVGVSYRSCVMACLLTLFGCGGGGGDGLTPAVPMPLPPGNSPPPVTLEDAFPNLSFTQPLLLLQPPEDFSTWFVVERAGVVRAFNNDPDVGASRVFVDLSGLIDSGQVEVPATECPRLTAEFLEDERRALGDLWFRQEYLCQFADVINAVFRLVDIERSITDDVAPLFETPPVDNDVRPLSLA